MDISEHSCHGSSSSLRYYDNHCLGAIRCLLGGQQQQHRQQQQQQQQRPSLSRSTAPPEVQHGLIQQQCKRVESNAIGVHYPPLTSQQKVLKNSLKTSLGSTDQLYWPHTPFPSNNAFLRKQNILKSSNFQQYQQQEHLQSQWKKQQKDCTEMICLPRPVSLSAAMTDVTMVSKDGRCYANVCNNMPTIYGCNQQRKRCLKPSSGGNENEGVICLKHRYGQNMLREAITSSDKEQADEGKSAEYPENNIHNDADLEVDKNHDVDNSNEVDQCYNDYKSYGAPANTINQRANKHYHYYHHAYHHHHHHHHSQHSPYHHFSSQQYHHQQQQQQQQQYPHQLEHQHGHYQINQHQHQYQHHHHHHHHHHHRHRNTNRPASLTQHTDSTVLMLNNCVSNNEKHCTLFREDELQICDATRRHQSHRLQHAIATLRNTKLVPYENRDATMMKTVMSRVPPSSLSFNRYWYNNMKNCQSDQSLLLTENYQAISPPAEYAEQANNIHLQQLQMTNIGSNIAHFVGHPAVTTTNHNNGLINATTTTNVATSSIYSDSNHKSLPDLHSHINRFSPHSEILSCCSRGNRSIKSTGGESSLNRDSGGSSGHYTHRSEPCYRQYCQATVHEDISNFDSTKEMNILISPSNVKNANTLALPTASSCMGRGRNDYRRDSGSSTQHSNNSYCQYSYYKHASEKYDSSEYSYNNIALAEVPEAFQDNYIPPAVAPAASIAASLTNQRATKNSDYIFLQNNCMKMSSNDLLMQSSISGVSPEDISPPPMQFKRQKCIRYKNHNRLLVMPSSVIATMVRSNDSFKTMDNSSMAISFQQKYHTTSEKLGTTSDIETANVRKSSLNSMCSINSKIIGEDAIRRTSLIANNLQGVNDTEELFLFTENSSRDDISLTKTERDIEQFFERLGLNEDSFKEVYVNSSKKTKSIINNNVEILSDKNNVNGDNNNLSTGNDNNNDSDASTIFFSDISTVDSMRLPDSTETQTSIALPYRSNEPPSIVERNARIIKWLCNIRKTQITQQIQSQK